MKILNMFLQIGTHWIRGNDRSFSVQLQMIHHSNHLDPEVRKAKSEGFLLSNIPNPQKPFQQGVLNLLLGDNTSAKNLFPRVFLEWLMWYMQVLPWCPESLFNSKYTLLASIHLLCRLFSIIWFIEWVIVICSCISSIKIIQHMSSTRPKPHLKRHFSLDTDPVATLFLSFSHQDCHSTASAPEILAAMLSCPKRVPDGIEPSQMSQVIYQQLL